MSTKSDIALVAQIQLHYDTLYVTNRAGITLDSISYDNSVLSYSNGSYIGNIGDGHQIGNINVVLNNGETIIQNGYKYDITDIWNNKKCIIKRWSYGDTTWAGCDDYYSGIIKDFEFDIETISFSIDNTDYRDKKLLPLVKCVDQSGLSKKSSPFRLVASGSDYDEIRCQDTSVFDCGDFIRMTNISGDMEYAYVYSRSNNNLRIEKRSITLDNTGFTNVAEHAFVNLPKKFIGKTIPVQIGDLTDTGNGVFGKTVTVNSKIGEQAIVNSIYGINTANNIGVWDKNLERYYEARKESTVDGDLVGEYNYNLGGKSVIFRIDIATTITATIPESTPDLYLVTIDDPTKIQWVDEDDIDDVTDAELITTNIVGIDKELMQIITKPDHTGTIKTMYVERGFAGTDKAEHTNGTAIYQVAKYSSRNLLLFTERFEPVAVASPYTVSGTGTHIQQNTFLYDYNTITEPYENMVLADSNKFSLLWNALNFCDDSPRADVLWDIIFKKTEMNNAKVFGIYVAIKAEWELNWTSGGSDYINVCFNMFDVSQSAPYGFYSFPPAYSIYTTFLFLSRDLGSNANNSINSFDSIKRNLFEMDDLSARGPDTFKPDFNEGRTIPYQGGDATFKISTLSQLNNRWRLYLQSIPDFDPGGVQEFNFRIERIGLWVDFGINYTTDTVVTSIKGLPITSAVNTITGTTVDTLCENPVDVLALLLTKLLGYETSDFSSNWSTVRDEYNTYSLATDCAFSYGVEDEQLEGWELCETIAAHYGLVLTKLENGNIDIVHMYKIYNYTPAGTEINIENDILFLERSSTKRMTIQQTGSELIYNDVTIKYCRNNYTGDYQKEYTVPATYILKNTMVPPIQLSDARNKYYDGKKRSKIIETPFIYQYADAERIGRTEIDMHACVNMWVNFYINYTNSLHIGDVIYFVGKHNGVTFTSERKFYVQNYYPSDEGRELRVECKSIDPIDAFVDPDNDNTIHDTGGTSLTGDDIWHDTGGTSITGDDIIHDTGGNMTR